MEPSDTGVAPDDLRSFLKGHFKQTVNNGRPMRLRDPFDTLVVLDGAVHLTSSTAPGQRLDVPENAHASLVGVIADCE